MVDEVCKLRLTHVARGVPPDANLEVMVVGNEAQDLLEKLLALPLCNTVHATAVETTGKQGLPAGDGVGADHGLGNVS